ncbi:MAG: hypothetical protein EOM20_08585 [Spartobacteria bacterium]|nr:hypothetical protein [Spartobacteria bacterium]
MKNMVHAPLFCVVLLVFLCWGGLAMANTPDFMIDEFENGSLTVGFRGTAGIGTAPFLYSYEKDGQLSLTYIQPDGHSDLAWWEGLSWSWSTVDVSAYYYFQLDVQGMEGGEDATVEFHYRDVGGTSYKPFIRLSDYKEITTEMQTVNIPIEDFESFDKMRASAVALGFRYVTDGVDSMQLDNIGLSVYPTEFFYTHAATAAVSNVAALVFKPHYPQGATPCSAVSVVYAVNGGSVITTAATAAGANWRGTVSNLAHGATIVYHFIHDYDAGGVTPDYTYTHNSVIDHQAPTIPGDMAGTAVSPTQVDLTWSAASDNIAVAGYKIYRNDVEIASTASLSYSAINLTAGTAYSFYVRAFDAAGNYSGLSDTVNVTTPQDEEAPTTPTALAALVTGPTTVELTWHASTDNLGVEGYRIMRDGGLHALSYETNFMASGVAGSNHSFCVVAYDRAMNLSASSTAVQVSMPADDQPPSVPTGLTGEPDGTCNILLTWQASTDNGRVERYEVFRDGLQVERTEATNINLFAQPDTIYSFAVRAVDSVGNTSAFSSVISVTSASGGLAQKGSYAATVPTGHSLPPSTVYVTTNMAPPYPTGDWWTSLMHVRCSGMLPARPVSYYAKGWALEFSYPTATVSGARYSGPFVKELAVGATGGSFPSQPNGSARVDGYGDFSVRARIGNDDSHLTATLTHGSPFAYIRFTGCDPSVACPLGYTVIASNAEASYLLIRIPSAARTHYALFAPSGTIWQMTGPNLITPVLPGGKDFLSVAILPDHGLTYDATAFELLRGHAYAFITNTTANFYYERTKAMIHSTFSAQTESMQGDQTTPLLGLLPHHWKNTDAAILEALDYQTVLGALKITDEGTFTARHRYSGIVPQFPEPFNPAWSRDFFASLAEDIAGVNNGQVDTYWHGKDLERLARVIPALDAAGLNERRDILLTGLRTSLTNMFTYTPGENNQFFAYNAQWGALHGYNESYGSVALLSDNHFHYGMFVYSAAILGMYDPFFAFEYREIVDKIIRQYNNPSRDTSGADPLPWMRCFDPWEGHCWATGLGGTPMIGASGEVLFTGEKSVTSPEGPDEESSSESMNAWAAMFLWGLVTGNDEFIDMGAAGYAIEADAIREYWYDADQSNYPANFTPTMVSRVFGSKVDALTWFSSSMDHVWGIQYILTGPHMTYQGYFKDYRILDYNYFKSSFGTESVSSGWKDIHWMYRCFFEPETVLAEYSSAEAVNSGNTQANLYYWINAMISLGEVNTSIYSDHPALVVLSAESATNYIAFNYANAPVTAGLYRADNDLPVGSFVLNRTRSLCIRTDQDEDNDSLSNGDELLYGTDLHSSDTDGDGMIDGEEIFTGMDPLDASSVFVVGIRHSPAEQQATFTWQGHPDRHYRLCLYPSLADLSADANASNLVQDISGSGWMEQSVTLPPLWSNGFLRLHAY